MSSGKNDPLDWSVDEVVEFLCHNPSTPWSKSARGAPRPDPSFEASLRDNIITGEVLLSDVDKDALRNDLVGEHHIIDERGRKRRRIDLTAVTESQRTHVRGEQQSKEWYMGPEQLTPSQLFYSSSPNQTEKSFAFIGSDHPIAQRHFVNKSLRHFYRQQLTKVGKDSKQWAMMPYDPSKVENGQRLFTLYTPSNGEVTVSTEDIENWPQLNESASVPDGTPKDMIDPSDPFSYFLRNYPVQDDSQDAYPLYGDSGSEGEFDEETWQEIEEETQEQQHATNLTHAEVEATMKDCVTNYENQWREVTLPKEERKAYNLWLTAKKRKSANQQIKEYTWDISLLEKRLGNLQKAIREGACATRPELEALCQTMEPTVADIQKQKWRISVLNKETCPPKISVPPKTPSTPRPKLTNEDEESLHSESDDMPSEPMDDFIDDFIIEGGNQSSGPDSRTRTPLLSESDDDIISPSGVRRKSMKRRLPFRQSSSPSPPPINRNRTPECIDLTVESPAKDHDDFTVETPPLNPVPRATTQTQDESIKSARSISPVLDLGPRVVVEIPINKERQASIFNNKNYSDLPDLNDIGRLMEVPWVLLEELKDRRRVLAKLIAGLSIEERRLMAKSVPRYSVSDLQELTGTALKLMRKGELDIPELSPAESNLVMRIASLYISWVNCVHLMTKGISKAYIIKAQNDLGEFLDFFTELCDRLISQRAKDKKRPSKSIRSTSDSAETPHKKRKRDVLESQYAKKSQERAQRRVVEFQEKQRKMLEQTTGSTNSDPNRQAVSFGDPVIYLDPHIGLRVKPHQLNGIQFLWRELIEDEKQQGCLLAHTMGLGKTMQVISLLTTISAAATSGDPGIYQQIPTAFRRSQSLILCPSSLIENWYEEFLMWAPQRCGIGPIRKITSSHSPFKERLREVLDWDEEGGVLIMSYDIFRNWIHNKETKTRRPLDDADHATLKKCLLDGPNIIVADEAHKMKNPSTGISKAAMQFRSKSRIALTGSPLANNLVDYFTMVNWIAEDYLGEYVEFKAKFLEPIEEGLYVDSTYTERRRSLVKLQVLKEILDPKINRADITVLAGSLPTKIEFVITVPLTEVQQKAYNSYVDITGKSRGAVGNAQLWSWLAILGLCCNHPVCFKDKLLSRASDAQKPDKKSGELDMLPGDEPITQAGLPEWEELVSQQEKIFAAVTDVQALELSHRAWMLNQIVDKSIKAGDKVLIFSHSIPTLDYIEDILKVSNRKYSRLDGHTPVVTRQAATKRFNQSSDRQVYLISTRAGGLGLNIPGANRVIIYDFTFSPVWEEQAVGRAYRLGQQKPVYVYRFIAGGTFEEVMYNKAIFKTQLAFRVVDKKNPIRTAQKSLGEYLFPAKPVPQEEVAEFMGRDPEVLDKILKRDSGAERIIRKIALTETFQKEDNDKLTDEERLGVQQQLSDERLKRTDPEAYNRLMQERQRQVMSLSQAQSLVAPANVLQHSQLHSQPHAHPPMGNPTQTQAHTQPSVPPSIPSSAHNTGPPALPPDMSVSQEPTSLALPSRLTPTTHVTAGNHATRDADSEPASKYGMASTPRSRTTSPGQNAVPRSLPQVDGTCDVEAEPEHDGAKTDRAVSVPSTTSSEQEHPCQQQ
ncbi:P-loop containing nucleoside triphosphate hydrolase protein [Aspergillus avenaceus]|uniref:P-loop containing nucleoside triphosphate hydrolase protein n=1 Tax=Aspergillus avenaceus TaxID=36643 RepID=A0A5N6TVV3_ASPAV|nr:P-loop containing nucleoside triphosphate hydrolase protein [Aspergillus avenaceus]